MLDPTSEEQMLYQALLSTKDVNAVILDFERAHREVSQRRASTHRIPSPPEEVVERTPSRVPSPPAADLLGLFSPLSPLETYLAGKSGTYVGIPPRSQPIPSAAAPTSVPPVAPPVPQPTAAAPTTHHKSHHKRRDTTPSSRSSSSAGSSSSSNHSQITRRKGKKAAKKAPKAAVKMAVQPVAPNGGVVKKVVKKVMVPKKATPAGSTAAASKPSTPKLTTATVPTSVSPQPMKPTIQKTSSTLNTQQQQPQKDFVDNYPFQSQVAVSPGRAFRNQPYQQSTPLAPSPTMEPSQFKRLLLSAGMVVSSGSGGYTASPDGSLAPQDRYVDAPNTSVGPQVRRYPNHSGVSQMSERALRTESEPPANSLPTNSVPTFPSAPNITAYFSTGHGSTVTPLVTHWSQPALFINREVPTVYRPANAISVPIHAAPTPYPEPQQPYPEASYPYSTEPVYSSSPQRRPILSPPTEDTVAPYHHIHAPPPPVLRERDSAVAVSPGRYSRGHRLLSPQMGGEPKEAPPPKGMFC